ncbi:MAG: DUF3185 family protein [Oscillospiraceae bacterium]
MFIFGIVLLLGGIGLTVYGFVQNSSLEAQLGSFLSSGSVDPGTMFIVIGVVAALVGIALLFKKKK